ncbi:MAG TPA: PAS domain S-box protein [Myxococcota bacterium]|nr:PAS domain S-box protein [Myxococcota bacterium]
MASRSPAPGRATSLTYGYVVALAATALALCARAGLDGWLGPSFPFITLYGGVAAVVWFGGWRPALLSALVGGALASYFWVEPRHTWAFAAAGSWIALAVYAFNCSLIAGFGHLMQRAQQQAREQRELVRITLASIGDAVISTDPSGRILSLNAVAESLTGWSQAEAAGQPLEAVFRIVNEETRQTVPNPVLRALREGTVVGLANHTLLIRRDGSELQIDDSAAPIRGADGKVEGCVLVFRDISARRGAERHTEQQLDAARFLAAIVTSSDDAIVSKSLDGVIRSWNAGAERLFGYTAEQAVGRHISLIIPAERLGEEDEILRQMRAGQRIDHFNTVRRRSDGREVHVSLSVSPIRDDRGRVLGASKIARDISAQKESEARVARLMEELRLADQRKDEFIAMLAHELRGPLAPVRNSLEILKRGDADASLRRRARVMLDRQVAQIERLVDDLLDVARITRNRLELRTQRVELGPLLQQAVDAARPSADAAKHQIALDVPSESLVVNGDPVRLVQVFGNLLHNANKYTDPGGQIDVRASRQGNLAVVSVRDNGIGIEPDLLPRVFQIFAQVDQGSERSQGGLGLGLTLVKRLVEMHGGGVEAASAGHGLGSEFVVRLPLAAPLGIPEPAEPPPDSGREVTPRRVLVVDDMEDSAESLAMLLRLDGHQVHVANDGLAAIEAAERLQPDLMLLDLGLPSLSGYEVCRQIRKQPWGREIRIVALTGWGQDEDRRQTQEAGFDAHLVKPIEPRQLAEILRDPQRFKPTNSS